MKTKLMLAAAVVLGLASCSKEESKETGYSLTMRAGSAPRTAAWSIDEAWALLHEIELERDLDDDDDETEIDIEGNFTVNLLTGVSTPPLPTITIPAGTYNELEVELGDDDNNGTGQTVFYVRGTAPVNGNTIPFEVNVTQAFELEILDDDAGIFLPEGDIKNLVIWVDVLQALSTLDLSNASLDQDGVLRISQNKNSNLFSAFLSLLDGELED